jgi:hypothetical protein
MKSAVMLLSLLAALLVAVEPTLSQSPPDSLQQTGQTAGLGQPELIGGFSVFAGVSLPLGAFASTSGEDGGAALTGFAGGAQYSSPVERGWQWMVSACYSYNTMDDSPLQLLRQLDPTISINVTSWTSACLMGGVGVVLPMPPRTVLFFNGQAGVMFATSPEMNISGSSFKARQNSSSAVAPALALGGGFSFGVIDLSFRYLYAKPKYHITASGYSPTSGNVKQEGDINQPMSAIQIVVGFNFQ